MVGNGVIGFWMGAIVFFVIGFIIGKYRRRN